jgi:two-component system, NtrC family, response regulator AtoC
MIATEGLTPLASEAAAPSEAPSLLVVSESGVFSRPLSTNGEITIGRSDECDVIVDDPKMSRRHLLVRTGEGGLIEVVDLGSANGTILDDRRLVPNVAVALSLGATLTAASTVIIVRTRGQASRACGLVSHAELRARLVAECDRATETLQHGDTFALVRVHVPGARDTDAIETVLGDALRRKDVVAAVAPGMYVVLLLETSAARADAVASRIVSLLEMRGMDARLHVAVYPRDGDTPGVLARSEGMPPTRRSSSAADGVVFAGSATRALDGRIDEIAAGDSDVVIFGEAGAGKETVAREIHARSARAGKPFVRIDCASPAELPSELLGTPDEPPLAAYEGGTVFLDEIGEMTPERQAKVLEALAHRDRRSDGREPHVRGVRVISTTRHNIEAQLFQGRFDETLLRRLDGSRVVVPPMRARADEIELLSRAFVRAASSIIGKREEIRISAPALVLLKQHSWPYNVRELKEVIERAVLLVSGNAITLEHLPCEQLAPVVSVRDASVQAGVRARTTTRVA